VFDTVHEKQIVGVFHRAKYDTIKREKSLVKLMKILSQELQ